MGCADEFGEGSQLSSVTLCLVALGKGHLLNQMLTWPVSPRDLSDSSSQSWDYMLVVHMDGRDLNWGHCVFTAGTLPTEPCPRPWDPSSKI